MSRPSDLDAAKSLVAQWGTAGMKVTVWAADDYFPRVASNFRDLLEGLGYRARLRAVETPAYQSALYGRPRRSQIAFTGR